jgi:PadR family transcriptional regulator, regulatory protein AphA
MQPADSIEPQTLTPTGRVILGMLSLGRNTGYDIKQFVDKTTRHFWAVSYGQIYPELRRLEEQGLIAGRDEPTGGRARTVYEMTEAGHRALAGWLQEVPPDPLFELRCETLLKLFFSDAVADAPRADYVRVFRAWSERRLEQFRGLQPEADEGPDGPSLSLEFGLAFMQFLIDWTYRVEERLAPSRKE